MNHTYFIPTALLPLGHFYQRTRLLRSDQQKRSGGAGWCPAAMLPLLQGPDGDSEQRGELLLGQSRLFAND